MKFFYFIAVLTLSLVHSIALSEVSKTCGEFEMRLEGAENHLSLGRALYRELYEELEELSLETEKIDVCSFKCEPQDENSIQCHMHLRLEYSYLPFIGEYSGTVYCQESYTFDGLSDYETVREECDLTELSTVLE